MSLSCQSDPHVLLRTMNTPHHTELTFDLVNSVCVCAVININQQLSVQSDTVYSTTNCWVTANTLSLSLTHSRTHPSMCLLHVFLLVVFLQEHERSFYFHWSTSISSTWQHAFILKVSVVSSFIHHFLSIANIRVQLRRTSLMFTSCPVTTVFWLTSDPWPEREHPEDDRWDTPASRPKKERNQLLSVRVKYLLRQS